MIEISNMSDVFRIKLLSVARSYWIKDLMAVRFFWNSGAMYRINIRGQDLCSGVLKCRYSQYRDCSGERCDSNNESCSATLTSYYYPSLYLSRYFKREWKRR